MATAQLEYDRIHVRLQRERGNAKDKFCIWCGTPAHDWALQNAEGRKYSEDLSDYAPMCRPCHLKLDWSARWGNPTYRERRSEASREMWKDPEHQALMKASGARVCARRRACEACGMVSHPGGIGRHQQISGHVGWSDLEEDPDGNG